MNSISDYVKVTAELINLPIHPDYRPGVIANVEAIAEMARLVTEFPLDETVEPAPTFHPSEDNRGNRQIGNRKRGIDQQQMTNNK